MQLTAEQKAVVEAARQGVPSIKVFAYAGAGKTSTLKEVATHIKGKGLYLAFNKAIADEANKKMPRDTRARTFHSLAYREFGAPIQEKLGMRINGRIAAEFGEISGPMHLDGEKQIPKAIVGSILLASIRNFCGTMDDTISEKHITFSGIEGLEIDDGDFVRAALVPHAQKLWERMCNDKRCPATHDVYVKLWAMSDPYIEADFILFDEAQDADPLMMHVINAQDHAQVIWVGDPYQQIYGWRGAQNAMHHMEGEVFRLTQSFRFGDVIAHHASLTLQLLGEKIPVRGISSIADKVTSLSPYEVDAVLCRTNATVMNRMMAMMEEGRKVTSDGIPAIRTTIQQLQKLKEDNYGTGAFTLFSSWDELQAYAETPEGGDIKRFIAMVEEWGFDNLYAFLDKAEKERNGLLVTTAHRAKGLEFDRVCLANDFRLVEHNEKTGMDEIVSNSEEINLFYVAMTRAKLGLDISAMEKDFKKALNMANIKFDIPQKKKSRLSDVAIAEEAPRQADEHSFF